MSSYIVGKKKMLILYRAIKSPPNINNLLIAYSAL